MRFSKIQPWQFYFFVGIYRVGKGGCHHSETWELIDPSKIGPQRFFRICYNPCPLNKTSQKQKDVDYRYFKPPKPAVWKKPEGTFIANHVNMTFGTSQTAMMGSTWSCIATEGTRNAMAVSPQRIENDNQIGSSKISTPSCWRLLLEHHPI